MMRGGSCESSVGCFEVGGDPAGPPGAGPRDSGSAGDTELADTRPRPDTSSGDTGIADTDVTDTGPAGSCPDVFGDSETLACRFNLLSDGTGSSLDLTILDFDIL